MGRILEAFATDKLTVDPGIYAGSPEYRKARQLYCDLEDQLLENMSEQDKELFEKYTDAILEANQIYSTDRFMNGYRLGVLMTTETFTESGSLFLNKSA